MARGTAGRWRRALVAAALAAGAVACSFLTSLDGLSQGGSDAGGSNDSGIGPGPGDVTGVVPVDASDAGGAGDDASGDAGGLGADASDASDASDAGADAGPYCASLSPQPMFCDDFDQDPADAAALLAPWDQVTTLNGTVQRKGGTFVSPPLAMLVTSTAGATTIDLCGYKTFKGAPTTGQFTLAFDLYVAQADTNAATSDAVLAALELLDATGSRWALQLEVSYDADAAANALDVSFSQNENLGKDASTAYIAHPITATLPVGAWTRVSMEATIGASDVAALHFGTVEVAKFAIAPTPVNGYPEILVGGTYAAKSTQGWIVRYDNVTFDVH